jgi:hypothetical protein
MSLYPPPTSNVAIFNPSLFTNAIVGVSTGGIGTPGSLNYPVAQGAEIWTDGTFTTTLDTSGVALTLIQDYLLQGVALNGNGFAYNNGTSTSTTTWGNIQTKIQAIGALSSASNASTLNVNNTIQIQNGETTAPPTSFISLSSNADLLQMNLCQDGVNASYGSSGQVLSSGGASGSMYWATPSGGNPTLSDVLTNGNTAVNKSLSITDGQISSGPLGYQNITQIVNNSIELVTQDETDGVFENQTLITSSDINITTNDYVGENTFTTSMAGSGIGFACSSTNSDNIETLVEVNQNQIHFQTLNRNTDISSNTYYQPTGFTIKPGSNVHSTQLISQVTNTTAQITGQTKGITIPIYPPTTDKLNNSFNLTPGGIGQTTDLINAGGDVLNTTTAQLITNSPFNQNGAIVNFIDASDNVHINSIEPFQSITQASMNPDGPLLYVSTITSTPDISGSSPQNVSAGGQINITFKGVLKDQPSPPEPDIQYGGVTITPYEIAFSQTNYIGLGTQPFGLSLGRQSNYNGANGIYGLQSIDISNSDIPGSSGFGNIGMYLQSGGTSSIQWVYPNDYPYANIQSTDMSSSIIPLDFPVNKPAFMFYSQINTSSTGVDAFQVGSIKPTQTTVYNYAIESSSINSTFQWAVNPLTTITTPVNTAAHGVVTNILSTYIGNGTQSNAGPYEDAGMNFWYSGKLNPAPLVVLSYQIPLDNSFNYPKIALQIPQMNDKYWYWKSSANIPVGGVINAFVTNDPTISFSISVNNGDQSFEVDLATTFINPSLYYNPVFIVSLFNDEEVNPANIIPLITTYNYLITGTVLTITASVPIVVTSYAQINVVVFQGK